MARYIDADALKIDIDLSKGASVLDLALSVIKSVKEAPAADVVDVVRCKDCRHSEICPDTVLWCNENNRLVSGEAFCSYGERKEQT